MAEYGERYRRIMQDAVAARFAELGVSPETCPATAALLAMTGLAQIMAIEQSIGFTTGHRETDEFVRSLLERIERGD